MSQSAQGRTARSGRGLGLALLLCAGAPLGAHAAEPAAQSVPEAPEQTAPQVSPDTGTGFVYSRDYPFVSYLSRPAHNEIARLEARLASGAVKLDYRAPRGYLDSLLKVLGIDPASQSVVFSKTSLQTDLISAATPRAIYFDDDTYIAWIPYTRILEISTMDSQMGAVFYTMPDQPADAPPRFNRETSRCLTCHDTYSMSGGGVPRFLFLSAYTRQDHEILMSGVAQPTSDETPLADRWGGWYVTGQLGGLAHLGNLLPSPTGVLPASAVHPHDLANLNALFDTASYLTDTSDAVALLVLEHQVYVHDLIVRASYKSRMFMEAVKPGSSASGAVPLTWGQLPPVTQRRMAALLESLVRGMLFVNAAPLPGPISGGTGFAQRFQARGPRDPQGRSLRDLDLKTRLFKYPLSFLIYSEGFKALPQLAKDHVYRRLEEVLTGRDASPAFAGLASPDRQAILEILQATDPDFARAVAQGAGHAAPG